MMMTEPMQPAIVRGALTEYEPMARHVTWRAGGAARYAFHPADLGDLMAFFHAQRALLAEFPPLFVGLGSNLLVRDGGVAMTAIFTHPGLQQLAVTAETADAMTITAEAGVAAPKLARFAANHSLEGAEFLAGVPGTVGGALAMNAGCYGSETWEHVAGVDVIERDGRPAARDRAAFEVGYRHVSALPAARFGQLGTDAWFVAGRFEFRRGDGSRARGEIKSLLAKRVASQPLQLPNAGSVFRNPQGDHAARLIESCGLKGFAIGGARVSEKHANFIVNPAGQGTASDIERLIEQVRDVVADRRGVTLEPEVRIVGNAGDAQ